MKKAMFITSVIMVVVMAIALTTSSLAWFTANGASTVTTTSLTLKAKVNSSAGLLICNDGTSFNSTSVAPATASGSIGLTGEPAVEVVDVRPVAPYGDDTDTEVLEALSKAQFTGKTVSSTTGTNLWGADAAYSDHYAGYVYVANGGDAARSIAAAINFESVTGATLYVAVLAAKTQDTDETICGASDDEYANKWEIVRVASSNGSTTVNSITDLAVSKAEFATGDTVAGAFTGTKGLTGSVNPCTSNTSTVSVGQRTTGDDAYSHWQKFLILAWYSADLTNYNSGATNTHGSFSVTFS